MKIENEKDVDTAARKLLDMGSKAVLIKGGHFGLGRTARLRTGWPCPASRSWC
ncbi:MAG: hypothetical protein V8Q84_08765 [Bilophila sp.]